MLLLQLLFQLYILTLCPLILEIMRWRWRVSCVRTVKEILFIMALSKDCAKAQEVSHQSLTKKAWIRSQASPWDSQWTK